MKTTTLIIGGCRSGKSGHALFLLMMNGLDDDQIIDNINRLCDSLMETPCPVILVSNEIGTGIVPENALARRYRDLTGWCNQRAAAACQRVIWIVAGIAVPVKPQPAIDG